MPKEHPFWHCWHCGQLVADSSPACPLCGTLRIGGRTSPSPVGIEHVLGALFITVMALILLAAFGNFIIYLLIRSCVM